MRKNPDDIIMKYKGCEYNHTVLLSLANRGYNIDLMAQEYINITRDTYLNYPMIADYIHNHDDVFSIVQTHLEKRLNVSLRDIDTIATVATRSARDKLLDEFKKERLDSTAFMKIMFDHYGDMNKAPEDMRFDPQRPQAFTQAVRMRAFDVVVRKDSSIQDIAIATKVYELSLQIDREFNTGVTSEGQFVFQFDNSDGSVSDEQIADMKELIAVAQNSINEKKYETNIGARPITVTAKEITKTYYKHKDKIDTARADALQQELF